MPKKDSVLLFLKRSSDGAIISCLLFGTLVLFGWVGHIEFLKNPIIGQIPVAPTTGFIFSCYAISILLFRIIGDRARPLLLLVAVSNLLLACLVLSTYLSGGAFDGEQWLFRSRLTDILGFAPGRMAPNTAIGIIFSSISLVLISYSQYLRAQMVGFMIASIGYFTTVGYLFGFSFMYGFGRYTNMALPTGIAFILMSVSIMCYSPSVGLPSLLADSGTAGFLSRRLVPAVAIVPLVLGALKVHGHRQGLFDWDFGTAFMVVASTIVMLALIGITSRSLQSVDEERQRLADQRDSLMAVLIHDLKNPLIGADRVLEHMIEGNLDPLSIRQAEAIRVLKRSNEELLEMIKNLLELYRLDRGKETFNFQNIPVHMLIENVSARFREFAQSQNKFLRVNIPDTSLMIKGDVQALEHVLGNIVQNAIKYSHSGAEIELLVERMEKFVLIKTRDRGKGMTSDDLQKVFEPFSKGTAGRKFSSGSGLGLHLCQQIVRAHNGYITCMSEKNVGTTVIMSFDSIAVGDSSVRMAKEEAVDG